MSPIRPSAPASLLFLLVLVAACSSGEPQTWYKGNLHTHTLWSDGDDFPESVVGWYADQGYHFVSMSDHNTLAEGERWVRIDSARSAAYEAYVARFGEGGVPRTSRGGDEEELRRTRQAGDDTGIPRIRRRGDTLEVRLATYAEYSGLFNKPGQFLVIQSEEISDGFEGKPLHVNATNIQEHIHPHGGTSVTDVLQRNISAVVAQGDSLGIPMVPHVNHPNFGWAVAPEDLVPLVGERFFEVYNGHPAVHNYGDDQRPGTEAMWDWVNARRLALGMPMLLGLAVDDAHNYFELQTGRANPGRGWIMVRARELTPEALIASMTEGDFYGSSGVTLTGLDSVPGSRLSLSIEAEDGVTYRTVFVGVSRDALSGRDTFQEVSTELAVVDGPHAEYRFSGDELFVRATVISSRPMANPYVKGETEKAWIQPVLGSGQ